MFVRTATPADSAAIYALLDRAPRQRVQLGAEDIAAALATNRGLLLCDGEDSPAALLITLAEARPPSLPAAAPARVYVRGVAFQPHLSPTLGMQQLLQAFTRRHANAPYPLQLIAYGGEGWLDRVQYFALERLQTCTWPAPTARAACTIRDATPADLAPLATLDSLAFDPLWRYAPRHLHDALLSGPLLLAHIGADLIGYIALLPAHTDCTIARLAVHPGYQGQGHGRALLLAGLQLAQAWGCGRALLNTQATNHRSQQLYRSLGFRPTGESFAVFVLDVPAPREVFAACTA